MCYVFFFFFFFNASVNSSCAHALLPLAYPRVYAFLSFFSSSPPPPPPLLFLRGGGVGGLGHLSCQMPLPLGRKKRASAPPSIKIEEIFTDRTDEKCHLLRHFNVQFFVSVYICLCNSAIIAKTSRPDDNIHESYLIIYFMLVVNTSVPARPFRPHFGLKIREGPPPPPPPPTPPPPPPFCFKKKRGPPPPPPPNPNSWIRHCTL